MQNNKDYDMSLIGHLTELRYRLLIVIAGLVVCTVIGLIIAEPVLEFLTLPVQNLKKEPGRSSELTLIINPDGSVQIPVDGATIRGSLDKLSRKHMRIVLAEDKAQNLPEVEFNWGESLSSSFITTVRLIHSSCC